MNDLIKAAQDSGHLSIIPVGGRFDRAVDAAIARENANPQGLPAEDIAALDVPYVGSPPEGAAEITDTRSDGEAAGYEEAQVEQERSYTVGLPVTITVHPDGRVTYEVDLSEAYEAPREYGGHYVQVDGAWVEAPPYSTEILDADGETITKAVDEGTITAASDERVGDPCSRCGAPALSLCRPECPNTRAEEARDRLDALRGDPAHDEYVGDID